MSFTSSVCAFIVVADRYMLYAFLILIVRIESIVASHMIQSLNEPQPEKKKQTNISTVVEQTSKRSLSIDRVT